MSDVCSSDLAVEDEDLALGAAFAQVVIGTAVAEAELEHRPRKVPHQPDCQVEAVALRPQAPQDAFQPAQRAACTWRSWAVVCSRRCASTRMTSTPISGKSMIMRKNRSAVILRVTSSEIG